MNERIRQLWSQAGGHYNSGNQHTWPEYTIDNPEKFAEVIVQESIKVMMENDYHGEWLGEKLKEHFGVEE